MYDLEMRIMDVLCNMEEAGHAVDWDALCEQEAYGAPFEEAMTNAARSALGKMAGEDLSQLNLRSAPQMRELLYGKLGMHTTRKTKSGELSTDQTALEALSRQHPPIKKALEVREVHNLANRLDKWAHQYSVSYDKRVHASFNQVVAGDLPGMDSGAAIGSGRFSANDPSVQQLPKEWRWSVFPKVDVWNEEHWAEVVTRAVFGKHYWTGNFRDFMVCDLDSYIFGFDFSQIELRCLAGMAKEPYLIDAFARGVDIHKATAAMMLGLELLLVDDKARAKGKTINFGIVYGMGAQLLAEQLAIEVFEAEALLAQYMSAFTKVEGWIANRKQFGLNRGYVETYFGRKVTLWDLQSNIPKVRSKGERLCVNAPIQGTAADIMKIVMLKVRAVLETRGWWMTKVRMVNNIHDALVFDVHNSVNPNELRDLLRPAVEIEIPEFPEIVADWEIGQRWGSTAKWKYDVESFFDGSHWVLPSDTKSPAPAPEPSPEPVAAPPRVAPAEPQVLMVELSTMPTQEGWKQFLTMVKDRPGDRVIVLRTPDGELQMEQTPTDLTPEHAGRISLLLGGARVYYPTKVDASALSEGITL
jgi:DNA polymerase-1